MGQEVGAAVPPFLREAGSPSNTMSPGPRPTSVPSGILIHQAVWPQETSAKNWESAVPLFGGWVLIYTVWPAPRPTSSFILIHPTVWPQYTNVRAYRHTDSQDRTGNGPIAYGKPLYKWSPKNKQTSKHQTRQNTQYQ